VAPRRRQSATLSASTESFLAATGLTAKSWKPEGKVLGDYAEPRFVFAETGSGEPGIEILAVSHPATPTKTSLSALWNVRQGGQALPLLLVCLPGEGDSAILVGPASADLEPREMESSVALELIRSACAEPTRADQSRYLALRVAGADDQRFTGLRNNQLLADHTLAERVRSREDWDDATAEAQDVLGLEGRELVEALGFEIDESTQAGTMSVLRTDKGGARAIAVFLDQGESYEHLSGRFPEASPASAAIARARKDNLPFVILTRGSEIRLHQAADRAGVGRKDAAEAYVEADVRLMAEDERGFLPLIFSARALVEGGSFDEILEESRNYSADLSARLRERVYVDVVPQLAVAVANASSGVKEEDLENLYEQSMLVLFRLLFVAYAEDRDLLPYRQNRAYHDNSLKSIALELVERERDGKSFAGDEATDLWTRVGSVWEAVDIGNKGWGVPAYNGGLFSADASPAAECLATIELTNEAFGPALSALLVEPGDPPGPVDFRTLSVRDFGTVYEGLLESSISIASDDLVVDKAGNYVPAGEGDEALVAAGEIYHHNRSGARKSSGSYFTKEFAVEHLLDKALEPALDAHFERVGELLEKGDTTAAKQALFDFRCADIAMGSGHFLVAATDRIELRMEEFLGEHDLPELHQELAQLRAAAEANLGSAAEYYEVDDRMLLRRLIARRCVYGVDLNLIAVELARLALWVHTFVPGLPLSFLDHNLVCGNALTGIGTIEEAVDFLTEQDGHDLGQISVFDEPVRAWIDEASEPLRRLALATDSSASELAEVKAAQEEALERTQTVSDLFDLICAMRRGEAEDPFDAGLSEAAVRTHPGLTAAREAGRALGSLHFPTAFPEVFIRSSPGFDCLIGNPPWEEVTVEVDKFWRARLPQLQGVSSAELRDQLDSLGRAYPAIQRDYESASSDAAALRVSILAGPFPGMGTGDPDLYKAFSWRFLDLLRAGGSLGVVFPRTVLMTKGSEGWRKRVVEVGRFADVTTLVNHAGWVFEDVGERYTFALVAVEKGSTADDDLSMAGPYGSYEEFRSGAGRVDVPKSEFVTWSNVCGFPLLPATGTAELFLKIREAPPLSDGALGASFRPVAELHATNDRSHMVFGSEPADDRWPVYRGSSFNLWEPDTGDYFAAADPAVVEDILLSKRRNQARNRRSAFFGLSEEEALDKSTLPCRSPRIVFRDIARANDPRTVIVALVPGERVLTNKAPYLLRSGGDERAEAALLGVMSSLPFDWYARRWVELSLNFFIVETLPVPALQGEALAQVVDLVGRLAASDPRLANWASRVGVTSDDLTESERTVMIAKLDALVAAAYGLDRSDLTLLFETFGGGWDYQERLDRTLAEFDRL
jgi:hypothetical protein